jgi:formylglycine-generating enzyme required for sulfatase activity
LVEPLYDADATQHNIRTAIDKCESLGEHDRLIVFYAGHGWYKPKAKLGYIVPTEAGNNPNSDFLPISFITDIFRAVDAKHILLIVDCCFGGSFGNERNINVNAAMTEKVVADLDIKRSRMVLSSGGTELVADGYATSNNSPFTKSLLDILKSNKQGIMAFSSVFNALRAQTHWNAAQIPQYTELRFMEHEGGELALYCTDLEAYKVSKKFDFEPEMVLVKGGKFKMGCDDMYDWEKPIHDVTLSDFYIGKFPVIQSQWQAVMGINPSHFKGDNLPVENVSWDDIQAFLEKLNAKTDKKYRLPTEAEWEFAARGGIKSQGFLYSGSDELKEVAWFKENAENKTHPVGQLKPNELDIYDMSGNVWEWCNDWFADYVAAAVTNPAGPASPERLSGFATGFHGRVNRGGSWCYHPVDCRSTYRINSASAFRNSPFGFRLAMSL